MPKNYDLLIMILMFFCHIIDDFYLQPGILSNLKQRKWWKENAPDPKYEYDYIMALMIHGFSWACMIHMPIIAAIVIQGLPFPEIIYYSILVNAGIHTYIDHLKANKFKLDLITDQIYHAMQIIITLIILLICQVF